MKVPGVPDEYLELIRVEGHKRGSRARCLYMTDRNDDGVQALSSLAAPYAELTYDDMWMPAGAAQPDEVQLNQVVADKFFTDASKVDTRTQLGKWWLRDKCEEARTPNWDIASTCTIAGRKGLLLVEAKAHTEEFTAKSASSAGVDNIEHIQGAILSANDGLSSVLPGWQLSTNSHYQLSNRFAWAWKLAQLGVPVVLVYLGFLGAREMVDRGKPFASPDDWKACLLKYADSVVPAAAWERELRIGQTPMRAIIRAVGTDWKVHAC